MRTTLYLLGVGALLCSGCQTRPPVASNPAAATAVAFPTKVIFGGYVGQEVANSIGLTAEEELTAYLDKMDELRLYQYWKKKRMKF